MTFFFAWISEDEVFDPEKHARHDESLFSIWLEQKEGKAATARVLVKNRLQDLDNFQHKKWAILSVRLENSNVHHLFKGRLTAFSKEEEKQCIYLTLKAEPEDLVKPFELLAPTFEKSPFWDPLFVHEDHIKDPYEWMKTQPLVFYMDRNGGALSTSSFFEGKHRLDIGMHFFEDSLKIKPAFSPVHAVEITLEAQWVQKVRGYLNLGKKITRLFPEKMINTFTGKKWEKFWPKMGQTLGKSGYWVAVSRLKEITPPQTYPPSSSPLWAYHPQRNRPEEHFFKRFWFKARLILGWDYQQKRIERLVFTLKQDIHPFFQNMVASTPQKIRLRLQEISPTVSFPLWKPDHFYELDEKIQHEGWVYHCLTNGKSSESFDTDLRLGRWGAKQAIPTALGYPARASFFLTDRGYQAFEHALERAKTYLAYQSRFLLVSFSGTWEKLVTLTLDHTVFLEDPRLPGGKLQGKVVAYQMIAEGETGERRVEVTLAVNAGSGIQKNFEEIADLNAVYCSNDYSETTYVTAPRQIQKSATGLFYERYDAQKPKDEFVDLAHQHSSYLLKNLSLKNNAQEQEAFLGKHEYPSGNLHASVLKEKPTQVQFEFVPLKGKEALVHTIHVEVKSTYASPNHLD